jgi:6-phosphogluconolactonase (cycloisomerase 2 family)
MTRLALFAAALLAATTARAWEEPGAVFTLSDDPAGNAVLSFSRSGDGSLSAAGSFSTGGRGAGGGLGSQGALTFAGKGRFLLAVNAGSNEVSAFRVRGTTLRLTGTAPSGGTFPVSVTERDGLVYVVNAGSNDVSALRLDGYGRLRAVPGSTRPLGGAGPAQISFDPSGETLVVSEKATDTFSVFQVGEDGTASGPGVVPSAGQTPFGFSFTRRGVLVVSEAAGGAPGASAVSSYFLEDGQPVVASASVPSGESAACWVGITRNGRFAYTTNTASNTLSLYSVDRCGRVHLVDPAAGATDGSGPIDLAFTRGDRYLYVLNAGTDSIDAYRVGAHGELTPLGMRASGLPPASVGLLAR